MTDSTLRKIGHYCYKIYLGGIILLLSACGDRGMTDLEDYVAKIRAIKNPKVKALPPYKHVPPYIYEVQNWRDPFRPLIEVKQGPIIEIREAQAGGKKPKCRRHRSTRVRVGLELMPLDALQMKGTLEIDKTLWALVVSRSEGTIYKVKQGDYIGQHGGQITRISEDEISVLQYLPDGQGCRKENITSIRLLDPNI